MKFANYRAKVWAGMKEGAADNARTALADLQSTYHDILTGAPRLSSPSARTADMEIKTTQQDAYSGDVPVLESDPAKDISNSDWNAYVDANEINRTPEPAPEMDMER